jgi:hypothetical protein
MPIEMSAFVQDLRPESTILFFGAGSSLPSHAPSVARRYFPSLIAHPYLCEFDTKQKNQGGVINPH